jgi:hypothetical protein
MLRPLCLPYHLTREAHAPSRKTLPTTVGAPGPGALRTRDRASSQLCPLALAKGRPPLGRGCDPKNHPFLRETATWCLLPHFTVGIATVSPGSKLHCGHLCKPHGLRPLPQLPLPHPRLLLPLTCPCSVTPVFNVNNRSHPVLGSPVPSGGDPHCPWDFL